MISKFRLWLAAFAVAAAAAGGGLALAVPAAAATPPVPIHKVSLHAAYLRTLPHAKHGLIKDKTAPRSAKVHVTPRTVLGKAGTCTEPNCDLSYQGGPVQHSPKVYLLLWGPGWSATGSDTGYLHAFYSGLGASGDNWSTITSQYGDGSGHPSFGASVFAGVYQDTTTPVGTGPGGSIGPADLNAEADAFISNQGITDTADAQVVIASQSGTCFDDGWVGQPASCAYQPTHMYCAWHSNSLSRGETFTNLPYTLDAATSCGENFINSGSAGTYDGFSIVGGHEYAETITDPQPDSGWFDLSDNVSGGEIGDKCAWGGELWGGSDPAGDVTLATGTFAMQSLWSNAAGACVMSASPQDTVKVTNPGSRTGTVSSVVSLQVKATSSGGFPLTFSATGLPAGLNISSAGLIHGTLRTASTHTVTVTAKDTNNVSGRATFTWKVNPAPKPTGFVKATKLTSPQLVINDRNGSHSNGAVVQVWEEAGLPHSNGKLANQTWQVDKLPDGNDYIQLKGTNLCLNVGNSGTTNGTKIQLWTCGAAGGVNQEWAPLAGGQLKAVHASKVSRKTMVLDDPARVNGTQLQIWQSNGRPGQFWTLPIAG